MNRQWIVASTPIAGVTTDNFRLAEEPVPAVKPGLALIRNKLISVDPANEVWMKVAGYQRQTLPGEVLPGFALGEVLESQVSGLVEGDLVFGTLGWQDYALVEPRQVQIRDKNIPKELLLSLVGTSGLTAYYGLIEIAKPKAGDTVVVSAAAGSVGCFAAQIAKLAGCRVVGIAGGVEKSSWLINELKLDAAVDYKSSDFEAALRRACPDGIDVFFDNTGGAVFDAVALLMNVGGRIPLCGSVGQFSRENPMGRPRHVPSSFVARRVTMQGFLYRDFLLANRERAERVLLTWHRENRIKAPIDFRRGIEQAPQALVDLLAGRNKGKVAIWT